MKKININIPIFDWQLRVLDTTKDDLKVDILKALSWISPDQETLESINHSLETKAYDGGLHLWNIPQRRSLVLLYPYSSWEMRVNILAHEKRHVEDRILSSLYIDDVETAAYLSGYIAQKLIKLTDDKVER